MGNLGFFLEHGEQSENHEDQSYKTGFNSTIPNCDDSVFVRAKSKQIKKSSKGFNRK